MKYLLPILFLLIMVPIAWGEDTIEIDGVTIHEGISMTMWSTYYIDRDAVETGEIEETWEPPGPGFYGEVGLTRWGFVKFIRVRGPEDNIHMFEPRVVENEDCVETNELGYQGDYIVQKIKCTPNGIYRLEWVHKGTERK